MAKKLATVKQTSGGGFSFETKVSAYYAIQMLLAVEVFGPEKGQIVRIDFQNRSKGWYLDDILLTVHSGQADSKVALSVKSNSQFGKTVAPEDFIEAIWEQYLHVESDVFAYESDMMGLITSCQPSPPKDAIQQILKFAKNQQSEELNTNLSIEGYTSRETEALFRSFSCPSQWTKSNASNHGPAHILKYLYVIERDFENDISEDEARAVVWCRDFLRSGDNNEAQKLWHSILEIIDAIRIAGGYADRPSLVNRLKPLYDLNEYPDYTNDWRQLYTWSKQNIEAVRSEIGGSLSLPRKNQVEKLSERFNESNIVGLLGNSGMGKTVLAKLHANSLSENTTTVWINTDDLKEGRIFSSNFIEGLRTTFSEVLSNFTGRQGLLVIDRAERLIGDNDFAQLRKLFNTISFESSWEVLITCRTEHWERIQKELIDCKISSVATFQIGYLEKPELDLVYAAFPKIKELSHRTQLGDLIRSPKIIDMLAKGIQNKNLGGEVNWVGETDMINWQWESLKNSGENGHAIISLLLRLSELQADQGDFATSLRELSSGEISYIKELDREGICIENNNRISFQHDLYADWARYQNILTNESDIQNYLKDRVLNPFWHKAIRLYGQNLIEQRSDVSVWCDAVNKYDFLKDFLLDSIIFAANARTLLEKAYYFLIRDNGELLKRLLKRFLVVATCPRPDHKQFINAFGKDYTSLARTLDRMPLWIYWPTFILFLSIHKEDLLGIVPKEISAISKTWLRWTSLDFPFRKEVSELSLLIGKATYESRKPAPYSTYETADEELKYAAALLSAREYPDEVADLALHACGRIVPKDVINGEVGECLEPGSETTVPCFGFTSSAIVPEPWTDGPKNRVDEVFQKICLTTDSLFPLMEMRPEVAKEVILALIIELKRAQSGVNDYHWSDKDIGLHHLHSEFYPRGWFKGPFLNFLRINSQHGLDTIIRLVDFATERLIEVRLGEDCEKIKVNINGKTKEYRGHPKIYNWHRGDPWCPDVIASALMGLEKYLYECIDNKKDISDILETILSQANSMAFLGLVCEIGRYKPELFKESLKELLAVPELYIYENHCLMFNSGNSILATTQFSEIQRLMQEWENMPHRKKRLAQIAVYFFLYESSLTDIFKSLKKLLDQRIETNSDGDEVIDIIKRLNASLDKNNWKETELESGQKGWQYYKPENLQKEDDARLEELNREQAVLRFPFYCRQLLDQETALKPDDIETFWQQITKISQFTFDNDEHCSRRTIDSVIGGIAVLFKFHYEWLKKYPDRLKYCVKWIEDVMKHPPLQDSIDVPHSQGKMFWDSFISEVASILWAEDPASSKWRHIIADLVCMRHYESMALLMISAYQLRDKLGESFYQLVYLVLYHAIIGNPLHFYFEPNVEEENKRRKQIIKKLQTYKKQFVKKTIALDLSSWGTVCVEKAELIPYEPHRRGVLSIGGKSHDAETKNKQLFFRKRPEIDLELLSVSFGQIFCFEDVKGKSDLNEWLQFWGQILVCRLAFNQLFDENGVVVRSQDHDSDPGWGSDSPLLQAVAKFISRIENPQLARKLWKPILDLGPSDHNFIDSFLSWFFFYGFEFDCSETFIAVWKEIFDEVCTADHWSSEKYSRQWHNIGEVWESLLIIKDGVVHRFSKNESHCQAVYKMKEYYYKWVQKKLFKDTYSSIYYLIFLKQPIARMIRLESLLWMSEIIENPQDYWRDEKRLFESVSEYLSFLWENHKEELIKTDSFNSSYQKLLQFLVNEQNPMAIDLQTRMAEEKM